MVRYACLRQSCEGGAAHRPSPRGTRVGLAEAGSGGRIFMTAVLLALTASAAWGASDFLGGLKAKTVPLATVLFVSQAVGLLAIALMLALLDRPIPADEGLLLSLAAGAAVVTGLGLLYLALARGPVIVVAPVAAAGAPIPVAVGLLGGDPVSAPIAAGLACALLGSLAAA